MTQPAAPRLIDALIALDPLADLPRTGWLMRGVRPCESIAEHSYFVALTVMLLTDALRAEGHAVDGEAALRMALVHDAPEARTGDIPMPQKTAAMSEALDALEADLVEALLPEAARESWADAARGESLEARLVKCADKIQMLTKALLYERQGRGELGEFWSHEKTFADRGVPLVAEVFDELRRRRALLSAR